MAHLGANWVLRNGNGTYLVHHFQRRLQEVYRIGRDSSPQERHFPFLDIYEADRRASFSIEQYKDCSGNSKPTREIWNTMNKNTR